MSTHMCENENVALKRDRKWSLLSNHRFLCAVGLMWSFVYGTLQQAGRLQGTQQPCLSFQHNPAVERFNRFSTAAWYLSNSVIFGKNKSLGTVSHANCCASSSKDLSTWQHQYVPTGPSSKPSRGKCNSRHTYLLLLSLDRLSIRKMFCAGVKGISAVPAWWL